MDSLTDAAFVDLFDRIAEYIDLTNVTKSSDIEYEMLYAITLLKRGIRKAKRDSTKKKWGGKVKLLYILGRDGVPSKGKKLRGKPRVSFARRAIQFAEAHPRSRLALTLTYGKKTAQKILNKRLQKRLRTLAKKK